MVNEGRENNANWDGIWDVVTRIAETGWLREIRIPFRTLRFSGGEAEAWGVNFERKLRRLNEDSYWAPVPRIYDIQQVSLAGTLEQMRGLRPGKDLRVKPYALTQRQQDHSCDTAGDFDAGVDVKYGITSGLTWDFTVNTDFSQVEADEQQINLSRFNLFFPEKRDFFLENSGIFQFGGGFGGFRQSRRCRNRHGRHVNTSKRISGNAAVLQSTHWSVRERPGLDSDSGRDPIDWPRGPLLGRCVEHSAARSGSVSRHQLHGGAAPSRHPGELGRRRHPARQRGERRALQPSRMVRREFPIRCLNLNGYRGEELLPAVG